MSQYVNVDHMISYLRDVRANQKVNVSPYMDNALLNVQQLLELDRYNPIIFEWVSLGNCEGCIWKGKRPQKCSCCIRNRNMKDCYKPKEADNG